MNVAVATLSAMVPTRVACTIPWILEEYLITQFKYDYDYFSYISVLKFLFKLLINFSISCGHGSFSASSWSFIAWHTYYEPFNYQLPDLISSEYHYLLINMMWTGEGDLL